MEIVKQSGGCIQLVHSLDELNKKYLLVSDVHYDNPACFRKLLKYDMDEALAENAGIFIGGDLFCAMQGKYDPRRNKGDIEDQFNVPNYLDNLVTKVAEFLYPYRENIVMIAAGNHETNVLNRLETDLTARLITEIGNPKIHKGGYQGFVRFAFKVSTTSNRGITMYYHHGTPGGIISKGAQWVPRYASMVPDADIVWTGDSHDRWSMEHPQLDLTQNGSTKMVQTLHIKTGTYKQEFEKDGGWAIEKLVLPKAVGGQWLFFKQRWGEIFPKAYMT